MLVTRRFYEHEFDSVGHLRVLSSSVENAIDTIIHRREHTRTGAWRPVSVAEALSVPAIQRAVTLISSTTGMLSMQGFRNGSPMLEPPRLIVRPDPHLRPGAFYAITASNYAKYGEFVWWIANRDGDEQPSALVNVPLNELDVQDNPDNRMFPRYRWGDKVGTRWTPANPTGIFVHEKDPLSEPFSLRGEGPLQRAKAAVSISVEAQTWAANFYGDGGKPRDIIKYEGDLDATLLDPDTGLPVLDENGLSEVDRLKAQYVARDNNTPLVIDNRIASIDHPTIDEAGAQMLESRIHQRGDAALMFGIPGHFVEYVQSGTSLTYQTLETAFTELIQVCLQPLYLEPIEQAMSDLLPRSTVARFNVRGFLRPDIKTRFEVHGLAIANRIYGPEYAQQQEGILPGDVEFAPVPFAPPAALPTPIRKAISLAVRCPSCNKLVARALGPGSDMDCPRCKAEVKVA